MLQSLRVKNLALLEEMEVEFGEGLNILTGETGAGKSLLLDSLNLALGGRFDKDLLRRGTDSALVELVFFCEDEKTAERLKELELPEAEDGCVMISRRMQVGRSVFRINGETVTAKQVKELAEVLLDIHGQHEHQSLLHRKKHREILDAYCSGESAPLLSAVEKLYREYSLLQKQIAEEDMDGAARAREQALAAFEYQEIQDAALKVGEDEELEERFRFMSNSKKIMEHLSESYSYSGGEEASGAGASLGRALRVLRGVSMYDGRLESLSEQLAEVESLLADYNRELAGYMEDCEFDEQDFAAVEERLNVINRLKGKYGRTIEEVLRYGEERQELLEKLSDYETYMADLQQCLAQKEQELQDACDKLSLVRQKYALQLSEKLREALLHLNFLTVEFEVAVRPQQQVSAVGSDEVEFMISTNPGEPLKSLSQVASGGELSRIMLAIKTVLAERDSIDTLIFDEIDAGISGKTAWKVAEQLSAVAHVHQVICVTHLPQIAAMADQHFMIEKSSVGQETQTRVLRLEAKAGLEELARLLGSDRLTEAALSNAEQMREEALRYKREAR